MRILTGHRGWAMGLLLLTGCAAGGGSTQLPSVAANSPDQERAGYRQRKAGHAADYSADKAAQGDKKS